ncbi:uncharacterized protein LOC125036952 [Penaeus chinensis]|uniref:uncharacterized protein LOC125036952 n=1 Tax=Penaeus chinensis TaxID=139456 RepID=UPI001FB5E297|nr:uncharacterized protein LOC125036952 [Penaeus chinensis]
MAGAIFHVPVIHQFTASGKYWTKQDVDPITDYLNDWLKREVADNDLLKHDFHPYLTAMSLRAPVRLLWMASEELGLSAPTKYRALEIFNRFIKGHAATLAGHVTSTTKPGRERSRLLEEVAKRVRQQAPLRAFTCLMIASKTVSHKKVLSAQQVQALLKKVGRDYTVPSIMSSERRILEQIEFRCLKTSSVLDVVGLIVAVVLVSGSTDGKHVPFKSEQLYEAAATVLDFVFLKHEEVYLQLYASVTDSKIIPRKHKAAFMPVVQDRLLLAGSVVMSGAWLVGGEELVDSVGGCIARHAETPLEDLVSLSSCILYLAGCCSWDAGGAEGGGEGSVVEIESG